MHINMRSYWFLFITLIYSCKIRGACAFNYVRTSFIRLLLANKHECMGGPKRRSALVVWVDRSKWVIFPQVPATLRPCVRTCMHFNVIFYCTSLYLQQRIACHLNACHRGPPWLTNLPYSFPMSSGTYEYSSTTIVDGRGTNTVPI